MICKDRECQAIFTPQYRNGILISPYCPETRYKMALRKRRDKMSESIKKVPKIALKLISEKQKIKNKEIAKIKKSLSNICVISGCNNFGCDLAHLLNKGNYPEYYTKKENLVRMCRCHHDHFDKSIEFRHEQIDLYEQVASFDLRAANKYFGYANNLRSNTEQKQLL